MDAVKSTSGSRRDGGGIRGLKRWVVGGWVKGAPTTPLSSLESVRV